MTDHAEQALRESIPERSERWTFKPLANGTSGHPEDWGARFEIFSDAGLFIGFCLEEAHAVLIARAPEIPELEARISELESDLDTTEGLKSEVRGDLEQARLDIVELGAQRDALALRNSQLEAAITDSMALLGLEPGSICEDFVEAVRELKAQPARIRRELTGLLDTQHPRLTIRIAHLRAALDRICPEGKE